MWRTHSLKLQRRSTRTFRTAAWTWMRPSQGSSISPPLRRVGGSTATHSPRRRAAAVNDHEDFTLSLFLYSFLSHIPPLHLKPLPFRCDCSWSLGPNGPAWWWRCNIIHSLLTSLFFPSSPSPVSSLTCFACFSYAHIPVLPASTRGKTAPPPNTNPEERRWLSINWRNAGFILYRRDVHNYKLNISCTGAVWILE